MEINIYLPNPNVMNTIEIITIVVVGMYEVLSRVIPTSKTWSIVGIIVNLLKRLSDFLDNKTPTI